MCVRFFSDFNQTKKWSRLHGFQSFVLTCIMFELLVATAVPLLFLLLNCFDIGALNLIIFIFLFVCFFHVYVSVFGLCYSVRNTPTTTTTEKPVRCRSLALGYKFGSLYGYGYMFCLLACLLTYLAPLFFSSKQCFNLWTFTHFVGLQKNRKISFHFQSKYLLFLYINFNVVDSNWVIYARFSKLYARNKMAKTGCFYRK